MFLYTILYLIYIMILHINSPNSDILLIPSPRIFDIFILVCYIDDISLICI